jgi:hypothetical protein
MMFPAGVRSIALTLIVSMLMPPASEAQDDSGKSVQTAEVIPISGPTAIETVFLVDEIRMEWVERVAPAVDGAYHPGRKHIQFAPSG